MKFVLATHNPNKIREMGAILGQFGVEVVSPKDLGITVDVEETGTTFAENAMLKAKAICELAKLPAIADDSGLCVDALNGGPGVYSARYGGEGLDDKGRYTLLLQNLRGQTTRYFIEDICKKRPANNKFKRRWMNRINDLRFEE